MAALAWKLHRAPAAAAEAIGKRLFGVSIVYLFVLFAVLMIERAFGLQQFGIPFGHVLA